MRRRILLVLTITATHALIAAAASSRPFFYLNVATAQRVFGGSNGEKNLYEDVRAYHDYAARAIAGEVPYRDYIVEYPIGAFPLFWLPRLVATGFGAYRMAFAVEMLAFDALIVWLIAGGDRGMRGLAWYTLGLAALGALPFARFDLAPTAIAFAAATAWGAGHARAGGVLAGLGGLMKLFPAAVAGPGVVLGRANRRAGVLAFGTTCAIGAVGWLILGGRGMVRSLGYHAGRGLEIESIYGGVLIVIAKVMGWPLSHDFNHSSVELIAPGAAALAAMAPAVQLVTISLIVGRFRREGRRELVRCAGACVLAFAVFGKVLSPQYALWALPFAATIRGRWAGPMIVTACAITSLVYFWAGVGLLTFHPLAVALLNARNALLVGLLGVMVSRRG